MLRKEVPEGFQIFQVVVREVPDDREKSNKLEQDSRVDEILEKYEIVFRNELPVGFPPKKSVEHTIEIEDASKPPYRSLYQLSPA